MNFDANINAALLYLERAIEQLESGTIPCTSCNMDESANDTSLIDDVRSAREELVAFINK